MSDGDHLEDDEELLKIVEGRSRAAAGTDFVNRHLSPARWTNPGDVTVFGKEEAGTVSNEEGNEESVDNTKESHAQEGTSNAITSTGCTGEGKRRSHRKLQFLASSPPPGVARLENLDGKKSKDNGAYTRTNQKRPASSACQTRTTRHHLNFLAASPPPGVARLENLDGKTKLTGQRNESDGGTLASHLPEIMTQTVFVPHSDGYRFDLREGAWIPTSVAEEKGTHIRNPTASPISVEEEKETPVYTRIPKATPVWELAEREKEKEMFIMKDG